MSQPGFVPPRRIGTAPAATAPPFARGSAAAFLSRGSDPNPGLRGSSPPPGVAPTVAPPQRETSPPPEPTADRVSPPNAAPMPPPLADDLPAGVYSPDHMQEIRRTCHKAPSEVFRRWLADVQLGEAAMPDGFLGRDSLFAEVNTKKRVMDRKLPNQVLGILAKLTPENYDKLKLELLALPIRQSSDDQVIEVVDTMYNKAVRPEDAPYVELYARLMADLVLSCDVNTVGKSIRKAIIDKCQRQFEQPFKIDPADEVDADGNPLPEALLEEKRRSLKDRLRANIKFLGHLFICGMVKEPVVNIVLYQLLYGKDQVGKEGSSGSSKHRRRPDEFELEMFCDLIKKVVHKLSDKVTSQYIPGYLNTVKELVERKHVHSQRIHFMLQDLLELAGNGWNPRRRTGAMPMTMKDLEEHQQKEREREEQLLNQSRRAPGGSIRVPQPGGHTAAAAPQQAKFDVGEFTGIVERYIESAAAAELEAYFRALPGHHRADALTTWLYRLSTVGRLRSERQNVGPVLRALAGPSLVTQESAHRCMVNVAQKIVDSDEFDDQPKIFTNWTELVNASGLSPELHTMLLRQILGMPGLRARTPLIRRCIAQIQAGSRSSGAGPTDYRGPTGQEYVRRFRLLPSILGRQFEDSQHEETTEETEEGAEPEAPLDLLEAVLSTTDEEDQINDVELSLFNKLCSENWTPTDLAQHCKSLTAANRDPVTALKIVSTLFTYLRLDLDIGAEFERCKDALALFFKPKTTETNLLYLAECYCTYREFGRVPDHAFRVFLNMLVKHNLVARDFWTLHAQRQVTGMMRNYFGARSNAPDATDELKALADDMTK